MTRLLFHWIATVAVFAGYRLLPAEGQLADLTEATPSFPGTVLLRAGEQVQSGDWRVAENSGLAVQQSQQGNLLVFNLGSAEAEGNATVLLWASNAFGPEDDYVTTLQSDCNLVTTRVANDTLERLPLWETGTSLAEEKDSISTANGTACFWGITHDLTNLQIWQGSPDIATQLLWSFPTLVPATEAPTSSPTAPQRPNILLITTDDMNWDSVGAYGCPVPDTTPNIDKLASEGIQFDYGFVNIAVCTPSRHVILSGSHSHQTKTRGWTHLERVGPALPDALRAAGYFTVEVNKQQQKYDWHLTVGEKRSAWGRDVPFSRSFMARIIRNAGERPWFTVFNLNDPHRAFHGAPDESNYRPSFYSRFSTPSRVFNGSEIVVPGFLPDLPDVRTEIAQYYSSVRRADDNVGAILKSLEESGKMNNTIVVFMSDHGMSNPFAKLSCYQNGLRVPFIVRFPGYIEAGTHDFVHMISAVDLAPTLLELADVKVPSTMAGRSFVPLLQGKQQDGRDHVIGYYYRNLVEIVMYPMFVVHMRNWVYIYSPWVDGKTQARNSDFGGGMTWKAMREAAQINSEIQARVAFHAFRIRHELYNTEQDPQAYVNLAYESENRERVDAMRQILADWMDETDHPAKDLMKDPDNEALIVDYMRWEEENALAENLEQNIKRGNSAGQLFSISHLLALMAGSISLAWVA